MGILWSAATAPIIEGKVSRLRGGEEDVVTAKRTGDFGILKVICSRPPDDASEASEQYIGELSAGEQVAKFYECGVRLEFTGFDYGPQAPYTQFSKGVAHLG